MKNGYLLSCRVKIGAVFVSLAVHINTTCVSGLFCNKGQIYIMAPIHLVDDFIV